jgi:transcription antitermination protein NusB
MAQRHDTRDPRRARSRALKILFQADVRGESPEAALKRLVDDPQGRAMLDDLDDLSDAEVVARQAEADAEAGTTDRPAVAAPALDGFTRQLVLGVSDHRDEVDELIGRFARKWSVGRMPVVDRNVLRLATYEMLHEHTSPAVVINEALELAKALSTEASSRYVNGVLESVRKAIEERDRPGA